MSARLKKHLPLLQWLSKAKPKSSKAVIKTADKEVLDSVRECCLNVLKGNVPLTPQQKKRLHKHKHTLRRLASPQKLSDKSKRQLVQKGGFLSALLPPILSALVSMLVK